MTNIEITSLVQALIWLVIVIAMVMGIQFRGAIDEMNTPYRIITRVFVGGLLLISILQVAVVLWGMIW